MTLSIFSCHIRYVYIYFGEIYLFVGFIGPPSNAYVLILILHSEIIPGMALGTICALRIELGSQSMQYTSALPAVLF